MQSLLEACPWQAIYVETKYRDEEINGIWRDDAEKKKETSELQHVVEQNDDQS